MTDERWVWQYGDRVTHRIAGWDGIVIDETEITGSSAMSYTVKIVIEENLRCVQVHGCELRRSDTEEPEISA